MDEEPRRQDPEPITQAGGRWDPALEDPAEAPGVEDPDEIGAGVGIGDGTLAGPSIGGSNLPPAAGVAGWEATSGVTVGRDAPDPDVEDADDAPDR